MITKLFIAIDSQWVELPVYNRIEFDERLDEQLDSGSVQTISKSGTPFADYTLYRLKFMQDGETIIDESYFGFDTVEKRGEDYYIHMIELVEVTRIAMGIPIDGCKVTQPIEGEKKSLFDVVFSYEGGLISKAKLESVADRELYLHPGSGDIIEKMKNIPSPEFHWECGTLLWECLCDIGNVINCIPRVRFVDTNTKCLFIEFEPVNDITA